jgi:hypothetical protein
MYKNINSASRLHAILQKAQQQGDKATFQVWAEVFGVKGANDQQTAELVLSHLQWLHLELQLLEGQVRSANLSPHLYEGAFSRVRQIASPLNLAAGWQSYRGNLTADVLLALAFCNELLPDEEATIDPAELIEITKQVDELSQLLAQSALPEAVRQLVAHHLELIRTALAQYPIRGAKALREARREALGEIIEVKDAVAQERQSEEVSRLGKLWKKVNSVVDAVVKIDKVTQIGQRAWDALLTWTNGGGNGAV